MKEWPARLKLPDDLRTMEIPELEALAGELRSYMIRMVARSGGHLAPNLGVVELALALHSTFQSPRDRIIWDVGHQSYPHKLLTGRWERFSTLRCYRGLSGFPKPAESPHDPFGTGHSSTSISAALGLALCRDHDGDDYRVIAVIGDGALTGGMAFEALNHAGHLKTDLLVILNDNKMSIGTNVGAMSAYLGRIRSDPKYSRLKKEFNQIAHRVPLLGPRMVLSAERLRKGLKYLIMPGMIFEELGLTYFGPVDGHNIGALRNALRQTARMKGPVLLHVLTEKGKGYRYAEAAPEKFHGIGPFDLQNGLPRSGKKTGPTYTEVFGQTMVELAARDPRIVALTAAMTGGTGLTRFAELYPRRFHDVGIAEQHAVGMAAALAAGGLRPVVAIYSTFLQRAYDQIVHDVCLQGLPVVFAVDRAGVIGEDGETHQGLLDLSYLRSIPRMTLMAPRHEDELQHMLHTALQHDGGPVALRYPRGKGEGVGLTEPHLLPWGKGELLREGGDLLIAAAGPCAGTALKAARRLAGVGIEAAVINPRFIKPLDEELLLRWAGRCGRVLTVEENSVAGGFGSAVLEALAKNNLALPVKLLGIADCFVEQGLRERILSLCGLDVEGIFQAALACTGARLRKVHCERAKKT